MNAFITGGSGLIGQALTQELVQNGYRVTVLSRDPRKVKLAPSVNAICWDINNIEPWWQSFEEADVVINLAGENISKGRWTEKKKNLISTSRVKAGEALVKAIQRTTHKPAVFIQASGIGFYGTSQTEKFTETSPPGYDYFSQVAVAWEKSTLPIEEMGIRRLVIRNGLVLSMNGGVLPKLILPIRLYAGGTLGSGTQYYSWIHIKDHVRAIRFLIETPSAHGVFNLTAPHPVPMRVLGEMIAKKLHRPYWFPIPAFLLRFILGEMSMLILQGQFVVPQRLQELGFQYEFPSLEDALNDLI